MIPEIDEKKERRQANRRKLGTWVILSAGILVIYGGFLLIEAFFYGGDIRVAILTIVAILPIIAIVYFVYFLFPQFQRMPFYIGIMMNVVFLTVGFYLQYMDFYFFVMLLVTGTITTIKKFRLTMLFVIITVVANIMVVFFLVPAWDWLDDFRFYMQFGMYFYGSVFMLVQTYYVEQKEGRSDRALAAFSALLRSTPNLMAITGVDGKVLYLSDPMAKFIRFPRKEHAVGQPLIDLVDDDGLKLMFSDMLAADGLFEAVRAFDMDGERRHFKIVADKLEGEAVGVFIDIADITPTVISQQAATEAQKVAEEANKSKSNFLTAMSHEIRTPMNAIIGMVQIQLLNNNLPDEYAAAMKKIYASGNNLLGIINDILDMSKIETGKLELNPVYYDVPSLLNDAVQMNIMRIGSRQIEFIIDIDENLPSRMYGDELRLKQVLNNLLSNAFKYTEKGYVKLIVDHSARGEDIVLRMTVKDTGQGIKQEDQKKLFSEYSRFNAEANRAVEGTGIGLNITRNLIELMDGTIEVESEYGKGSTFTATVRQGMTECRAIDPEVLERLRTFTFTFDKHITDMQILREPMPYGKVLIVDDVETNLYVSEGLMAPYMLKIETAVSGFEAIDKVSRGNSYDVIFMDHMMPQMDGLEATRRLRALGYAGIIVALTANALVGNSDIFKQSGFDDFISKPIDLRHLNAVLNKYVRERYPDEAAKYKTAASIAVPGLQDGTPPKLLEFFRRDAEKAILALRETLSNGDIKLFTTTAHAMKAALTDIGRHEASARAFQLEKAGRGGDMEYLKANTESFVKTLEAFVENLRPAESTEIGDEDIQEDAAFLHEQLMIVKAACEDYDSAAAYAALDLLGERRWKKETSAILENIRDLLFLESDFEAAAQQAGAILG